MKKIFLTLVISIFSIFSVSFVKADELLTENEFKDKNLYQAGENVEASGNYDGISFVAGSEVDVNTNSLFGALAGMNVRFNGITSKDLFIAGSSLEINGNVKRDLYAAAEEVKITGIIEGNIYVASNKLVISDNAEIKGNIKFYGTELENHSSKIEGKISYYEDAKVSGIENFETDVMKQEVVKVSIKDKIINAGYSLLRYLFLFMVLTFTFPKLLKYIKTKYVYNNAGEYLTTCGTGVLGMFMFPIIAVLLLISNIGISVGLIMFVLYFILIYMTTITSGYILGNIIGTKIIKKELNDYLVGLMGIAAIVVLTYIPYLGTFIGLINLLFGFGVIIKLLTNRENRTL